MGNLKKIETIKVLIASSSPLVQIAITNLLRNKNYIGVIAKANNSNQIFSKLNECPTDILILDSTGSDTTNVIDILERINRKFPHVKTLLLPGNIQESDELLLLKTGLRGIFNENSNIHKLSRYIVKIYRGNLCFRPKVLERFAKEHIPKLKQCETCSLDSCLGCLTKRELEVFKLALRGYKNIEIGDKLFVSEKTVKNHLSSIYKKLDVTKRVELQKYIDHLDS